MSLLGHVVILSTSVALGLGCSDLGAVSHTSNAAHEDAGGTYDSAGGAGARSADAPTEATAGSARAGAGSAGAHAALNVGAPSDSGQRPGASTAHDAGTAQPVEELPDAAVPCIDQSMSPDDCHQLDFLILENPRVADDDGDGVLSPGDSATISLAWRETMGISSVHYPGVRFSTTSPGVTVGDGDWRYAALACHAEDLHTSLKLSPDIPLHTPVIVTAQIELLGNVGLQCSGDRLDIAISVGDRLP